MYITLDGMSGAGKSTQFYILSKKLGLSPLYVYKPRAVLLTVAEAIGNQNVYMSVPAHILATYSFSKYPQTDYISDHYWEPFLDVYAKAPVKFNDVVTFLRTGITLFGHPEPDLSIILNTSPGIADMRRIERETEYKGNWKMSADKLARHRQYSKFCKALEAEVSYCHIVNADLPVEEVTESIMELIRNTA